MVDCISIDLSQIVTPLCLLSLKKTLKALNPGELLRVKLQDPAVQKAIMQTLAGSCDQLLESRIDQDHIWLTIERGRDDTR